MQRHPTMENHVYPNGAESVGMLEISMIFTAVAVVVFLVTGLN